MRPQVGLFTITKVSIRVVFLVVSFQCKNLIFLPVRQTDRKGSSFIRSTTQGPLWRDPEPKKDRLPSRQMKQPVPANCLLCLADGQDLEFEELAISKAISWHESCPMGFLPSLGSFFELHGPIVFH